MADPKIKIRRSATPNKVPTKDQLQLGELAINTYDGKLYLEQDQGGAGVGNTVIAVNPWNVGVGSTAYNTHFTSGKVGVGTTNAQYNLDIGGNVNFTGNLYQDGSLYTSGTTGVGIKTAGGIVGYAATIIDFRGPGVTTAHYSSVTGIATVNFHSVTSGGGGGNASVTVSDSAPSSPSNGDLWFKSDVGELYLWYTDGSSNQWVEASGGSNTVVTSDSAPTSPQDGDLWWNSNTGELKVYYNDGNSSQWVDANSEGGFIQYWTQTNTNGTLGVTTTGYVGIGTTTATDALTVSGNANVTGFLTATQLNGAVSSTGVNVSGVATALNLISPVTSSGVNVTGVATALHLKGPLTSSGINVTGVSTFSNTVDINSNLDVSGNATIGGVLTYEDVRNVDSIGIVTARTGIKVLAGGANIVDGTTTDELNVTGVATAVQLNATTLNVTGVSTFQNNILLGDDDRVIFGDGGLSDAHVRYDGSNLQFGVASGEFRVSANGARFVNYAGTETLAVFNNNGANQFYYDNSKKLETSNTGISVTGDIVGSGSTAYSTGLIVGKQGAEFQGVVTASSFSGSGANLTDVISGVGIGTEGGVVGYAATILHFRGAGVTTAYYSATTGVGTVFFHSTAGGGGGNTNVTIQDAPPSSPSTGDLWWESDTGELKIYYNDGNSSQWVDTSGTDDAVFVSTTAPSNPVAADLWFNSQTGDLMIYYTDANTSQWVSVNATNSERIWNTNSTGIHTSRSVGIGTTTVTDALTVVGATDLDGRLIVSGITTFGSHVYHGDGDRAIFGDGSDLEIYHSGSHSYIKDSGTGSLFLGSNQFYINDANNSKVSAVFNPDTDTQLKYNNTTRFSTTDGGVNISGTVGAANTALVVEGDARITGILTVGTGSLTITDRDINAVGVVTGANFKSGTTNVHNVGVEAAGINVLGADTPIGTGATVYNSGLIVGKKGAEFQGVVTATTFKGALDGNAGTATLATNAQGLTGTPNITVGALTANTGQFSGNVNVLGTLTYEDVKNVDSAGIATARQGLRITGGGLDVVGVSTLGDGVFIPDNKKLEFGNAAGSGDLTIKHFAGGNSYITDTTNDVVIQTGVLRVVNAADNQNLASFTQGGASDLYFAGSQKITTASSGVNIVGTTTTGQLAVTGVTTFSNATTIVNGGYHRGIINSGAQAKIIGGYISGSDTLRLGESMYLTSTGLGINQSSPTVKLQITDTSATILRTEATANSGDSLIQADGRDGSGNLRRIMMRTDAGASQYRIISSDTSYNLALCTGNAPRVLIAGNSAATSIGGSNVFNAMLTVQGDLSGAMFTLKAAENTNRLMVSGNDTSDVEVNLYDKNGGQRGILVGGETEFAIKAPNNSAPFKFYNHNGSSVGERLQIDHEGLKLKNLDAGGGISINALNNTSNYGLVVANANRPNENDLILGVGGNWAGDSVAQIDFRTGADTTNKDDGKIMFYTQTNNAGGLQERMRIDSSGNVTIKDAKQLLFENDAQDANSAILNLGASGTSNLVLAAGGAEKMRIVGTNHIHMFNSAANGADRLNILGGGDGISIARYNGANASDGNILGNLSFHSYTSGSYHANAEAKIEALASTIANQANSGSNAPTDLLFYTKDTGQGPGSAPTEKMRIHAQGVVRAKYGVDEQNNGGTGFYSTNTGFIGSQFTTWGPLFPFFYLGETASSGGSTSFHALDSYASHHWGGFPRMMIFAHYRYFGAGFSAWTYGNYGGGSHVGDLYLVSGWGGYGASHAGSLPSSQTGSGINCTVTQTRTNNVAVHAGANVHRWKLDFATSGAHIYIRWYVGFMGTARGLYTSDKSQADVTSSCSSGGCVHMRTMNRTHFRNCLYLD